MVAGKTSGAAIQAAERRERAITLRKQGYSYSQLAEALQVSKTQARKDIACCLREGQERRLDQIDAFVQQDLDDIELELQRIDQQEMFLQQLILGLGVTQVREALKAHDSLSNLRRARLGYLAYRAKILGTAQPEKHLLIPGDRTSDNSLAGLDVQKVLAEADVWTPPPEPAALPQARPAQAAGQERVCPEESVLVGGE